MKYQWLKIGSAITLGVLHTPSIFKDISSTKVNGPLACGLFIYCTIPAPYANRSKLSILHHRSNSPARDNLCNPSGAATHPWQHPRQEICYTNVDRPSTCYLLLMYPSRAFMHQDKPAFDLWSFSFVSGPRLGGRALCQHLLCLLSYNTNISFTTDAILPDPGLNNYCPS